MKKSGRSRGFPPAAVLIVLLGLIAVAYANALPEELTYDAQTIIGKNPMIESASPWWKPLVTNYWGDIDYDGLYRPLTLILLRTEHGLLGFGKAPQGYVLVNILLHALVAILVWRLARSWSIPPRGAAAAGALFAVHPVATAVVPNIVGVGDLLAALFTLASLLAWEEGHRLGGRSHFVLAAGWWLAALLAKESAIVLPALVLLREIARETGESPAAGSGRSRSWSGSAGLLPMAAAGLAWFLARTLALSGRGERFIPVVDNPLVLESLPTRWMTALGLLGSYLREALVPAGLSVDYSFDQVPIISSPATVPFLVSASAVALAIAAAVLLWPRCRTASAGLLFFLVAIGPFCNFLFPVGAIRADRFLYLPLVGLVLAFGELFDRFARRAEKWSRWLRAVPALAAGLIVLSCLPVTRAANGVWKNNVTLWQNAVAATPQNVKAHYSLARYLLASSPGPTDAILTHLQTAVALSRRLPGDEHNEPYQQLGWAYIMMAARHVRQDGLIGAEGRVWLDRAVSVLREAEERQEHPGRRRAWWERVVKEDTAQGRRLAGLSARFGNSDIHAMLGTALDQLGREREATGQFEKAVAIAPGRADLQHQLGLAYSHERRFESAEQSLLAATRLDPRIEACWSELAAVRLQQGKVNDAIDALSEGRAFHKRSQDLERALRSLYVEAVERMRRAGRAGEAELLERQAIERDGLPPSIFTARPPA